jgi:hypothetical protein
MLGMIYCWLQEFATEKADPETWKALHEKAQLQSHLYFSTKSYPDENFLDLIEAGSEYLNTPVPQLVEEFGIFLVPRLRKIYGHLIRPDWKIAELLENVNEGIHEVVCSVAPDATPPKLLYTQEADKRLKLVYASKRKLCWLVLGLLKGFAKSFQQDVEITHDGCVHKGASQCVFYLTTG